MPTSSPENDPNDRKISVYDAITASMHSQKAKNLAIIENRKFASNLSFPQK
jgi:hypothetical protein